MSKLKVIIIIKRNASYGKGMYSLSIHKEPGGAANVQPINSELELHETLRKFVPHRGAAQSLLSRLKNKHDSVTIEVDLKNPSPIKIGL
jgi:hypothetical protein